MNFRRGARAASITAFILLASLALPHSAQAQQSTFETTAQSIWQTIEGWFDGLLFGNEIGTQPASAALAVEQPSEHSASASTDSSFALATQSSSEPEQQPTERFITYTVQAGDTLSGIAQTFGIPISNILAANDLSQHAILHPGGNLIIPDPQTAPGTSEQPSAALANTISSEATSDQTTTSLNVKSADLSNLASASVPTSNFVTQDQFNAGMSALSASVAQLLSNSAAHTFNADASPPLGGGAPNTIAAASAIDQLSGVIISNSTIDSASIPDLSGKYLSLSGGTLTGALIDSSTATSTFAGGVNFAGYVSGLTTCEITGFSYATSSNFIHIAAWGDSLTSGYGGNNTSWPTQLSLLTGYSIYNGGKGGDTSTQIATRMLAASDKYSWPTIIWAGRNNYTNEAQVDADIASMVAALQSVGNDNYIVLSILNGEGEGTGTSAYNQIIQDNNDLAVIYGSRYLDIRSYLVSQYNPALSQDVTDHSNDVPPTSLRFDFLHPNTADYLIVAQYILAHMSLLASTSGNPLLTTNNLSQFAVSPPTFGFVNSQTGYQQDGTTVLVASSTAFSTFVGLGVSTLSEKDWNTAVGYEAFYTATSSGSSDDAFGYQSLYNDTTGSNDAAYGLWSLFSNTTGSSNIAHGGSALYNNTTGSFNVGIGFSALDTNITGGDNAVLGYEASYYNNSATNTVAIGYEAAL